MKFRFKTAGIALVPAVLIKFCRYPWLIVA